MTTDEVQRVVAAAADVHELGAIALRLAAITGARRSELAALKWSDLDGSVLTIDSALTVVRETDGHQVVTVLRDDPTKTADRRRVALDEETVSLLVAQREKRKPITAWVFSDTEKPPHPDRIGNWWRRARTISEIDEHWRLHDLRHWSATTALGRGFDLATVAGRLGHADPSTTLRVYSHALADRDTGWPLSIEGLLRNADATRTRFSLDGRPFSAISAEVTVEGWTMDSILSGPRLQTRSRYAAVPVGELVDAGFELLPTFIAPHYSVLLDPYTPERAQHLLDVLGEARINPHHMRRQP